MARWKRAASVEGDEPRAWLLERRQERLEKIRGLLSAATTFEFSAFLAAHREREITAIERSIRDLQSGATVYVNRWEFPRSVDLPGVANRYAIDAQDHITAAIPGADEGQQS